MQNLLNIKMTKFQSTDKFILNLLTMWLLVDMCNGVFLNTGISIPLSQMYKGFLALFVIINNFNISSVKKITFFLISYFPIYLLFTIFADSPIFATVVLTLKPLTTLILYFYLSNLFYKYDHELIIRKFYSIVSVNAIVFFVNILLGFWGIGYRPYEGDEAMGFCGFFYSPNELSGVVAVLFPLVLCYVKIYKSLFYYLLTIVVMACCCYILTTKSPFVILAVSLLGISYFYGRKFEKRLVIITIIASIITATTLISVLMSSEYGMFTRIDYFIEKNGILWALTSGRFEYWEEEGVELYSACIFNQLFGLGGGRTVEMDPFDVLLNYGYIGFIALIILYYKILFKRRGFSNNVFKKTIKISNALLVFLSVFAGHILFSSMAGLFVALSNSLLFYKAEVSHKI